MKKHKSKPNIFKGSVERLRPQESYVFQLGHWDNSNAPKERKNINKASKQAANTVFQVKHTEIYAFGQTVAFVKIYRWALKWRGNVHLGQKSLGFMWRPDSNPPLPAPLATGCKLEAGFLLLNVDRELLVRDRTHTCPKGEPTPGWGLNMGRKVLSQKYY